jgi:uncharacterized protein YndB with AHSA1/START domain
MTLPRSERGPEAAERWVDDERAAGSSGGERVSRSVELDAAPAEVWGALTEEALLAEWLADEVEIEAEPGGAIVCRYADGEERRGEVELVEEAERLAWSWRREGGGESRVELVLDAVADGTRLTVIEQAPVLETGALRGGPLLLSASAGPRPRVTAPMLATPAGLRLGAVVAAPAGDWVAPLARLAVAARPVVHA